MDEFGLIEEFFTRPARRAEVVLGIGDDAALLALAGATSTLAVTTDTVAQAIDRSGAKAGNKGAEAALSILEMVDVLRRLRHP